MLDHAADQVRARTCGIGQHVLPGVGLRIERHQGLGQKALVGGVDLAQVQVPARIGSVDVAQGGVRHAILGLCRLGAGSRLAQDRIAAARIAGNGEHMAVIGGNDDRGSRQGLAEDSAVRWLRYRQGRLNMQEPHLNHSRLPFRSHNLHLNLLRNHNLKVEYLEII